MLDIWTVVAFGLGFIFWAMLYVCIDRLHDSVMAILERWRREHR